MQCVTAARAAGKRSGDLEILASAHSIYAAARLTSARELGVTATTRQFATLWIQGALLAMLYKQFSDPEKLVRISLAQAATMHCASFMHCASESMTTHGRASRFSIVEAD